METSSAKPYAGKRTLDVLVAGAACAVFAPLAKLENGDGRWLRRTGIDELPHSACRSQ